MIQKHWVLFRIILNSHILEKNSNDFLFLFHFVFSSRIEQDEAEVIVSLNPDAGPDEEIGNEIVNEWIFAKL